MDEQFPLEFSSVFIFLAVGLSLSWCVCKMLKIRRVGVPQLVAISLTYFLMVPFDLMSLIVSIVPFFLGFFAGRSTKVAIIPTDTFSPRIKISDVEYAYRAEQYHQLMHSHVAERFLLDPNLPLPDKMSFLFQGFGLYRHARALALLSSWFYFSFWVAASYSGSNDSYIVLCALSLPQGTALGMLWKYVRGHPGPPKPHIGGNKFRPTFHSFIFSSLYGFIPAIVAIITTYFQHQRHLKLVLVIDGIMLLISLFYLVQSVVVHLQKLHITENGVVISGWWSAYGIRWSDMQKAVLRERHNILSGTDKLLVIVGSGEHKLYYPVSILSKADQTEVMREVRRRIAVSSAFDEPSL